MKKAGPYILVAVLAVLVLVFRNSRTGGAANNNTPTHTTTARQPAVNVTNDDHGFNRSVSRLQYTRHAHCRMDCRHITQDEVMDILQHGSINYRKTEVDAKPCPAYALEGYTQNGNEHLRIVFAQCDDETKVVTCIDLDHDFECHCPGDGDKHEN